jgi:predicted phage-related endonuclease
MPVRRIPHPEGTRFPPERAGHITASVAPALWGLHPRETALGLFERMRGLEIPTEDSPVLERGLLYEDVVAKTTRLARPQWRIEKARVYLCDDALRLGATPDFWIYGDPERGDGVLEAKTIAPREFRVDWTEDLPPFWIALQLAVQMMLADVRWGAIAAWVVDPYRPHLEIFETERHPAAEQTIVETVEKFWRDVAANRRPNPDYAKDGVLARLLFPAEVPEKTVDLTESNRARDLLITRTELKARTLADQKQLDEIDNELRFMIGEAEIAVVRPRFRATLKTERRSGYTVPPKASRVLRVKDYEANKKDDAP